MQSSAHNVCTKLLHQCILDKCQKNTDSIRIVRPHVCRAEENNHILLLIYNHHHLEWHQAGSPLVIQH